MHADYWHDYLNHMLRQTEISQSTRGIAAQRHIWRSELACQGIESTNTRLETQSATLSYSAKTVTSLKANLKAFFL